ncbi:branched-chain amino acid transaminase [bacterium]|nr:branched-chain amino acid transaminase [bacterium]
MFNESSKIWHNGKLIPWRDASLHVTSHCIHYGSSVFEGIRSYRTPQGLGVFRLREHLQRLIESAAIYRMDSPHTVDEMREGVFTLLQVNNDKAPYIRPVLLRGSGALGIDPRNSSIEIYILSWDWGAYLGAEALEKGVDVCVSSWRRPAPDTFTQLSKSGAHYMNSQLIKLDAVMDNYHEGIALDYQGFISEGSGENVFLVRKNVIYTPPVTASLLPGITRESVMTLAADLGYTVREELISREMLYIADEVFFTGTASEITPIRTVDRRPVASGQPGPITRRLQQEFFGILRGDLADRYHWLDYGSDLHIKSRKKQRLSAIAE